MDLETLAMYHLILIQAQLEDLQSGIKGKQRLENRSEDRTTPIIDVRI